MFQVLGVRRKDKVQQPAVPPAERSLSHAYMLQYNAVKEQKPQLGLLRADPVHDQLTVEQGVVPLTSRLLRLWAIRVMVREKQIVHAVVILSLIHI